MKKTLFVLGFIFLLVSNVASQDLTKKVLARGAEPRPRVVVPKWKSKVTIVGFQCRTSSAAIFTAKPEDVNVFMATFSEANFRSFPKRDSGTMEPPPPPEQIAVVIFQDVTEKIYGRGTLIMEGPWRLVLWGSGGKGFFWISLAARDVYTRNDPCK